MAKDRDDNLKLDPLELERERKPNLGARTKHALTDAMTKLKPKKSGTPREYGPIQPIERDAAERSKWAKGYFVGVREQHTPMASWAYREMAEQVSIASIKTFQPERWIPAETQNRVLALQALEIRTKEMQGREGVWKVEAADLRVPSRTDHESRTIFIGNKELGAGSARPAVAALMTELHLLMQQHAVANPAAYAEHGIENIQRWASRVGGKPGLDRSDAEAYAKRVTVEMT